MWSGRRLSSFGVRFLETLGSGCPSAVAEPPLVTSLSGECRCGFSAAFHCRWQSAQARQRRAVAGTVLLQLPNSTLRPPSHSGCPSGLGVALPSCSSSSHKSRKSWELRIWAAGSVSRGPPPWSLNLWPVMFELRASAPGNPQSSCWSLRWCLLFLPDQERHTCWSHSTVSLFCCSLSYHHRRRI